MAISNTTAIALFGVFLALIYFLLPDEELRWNWKNENINVDQLSRGFSKNFLWGVATAAHQIEGNNTNNQWWKWEHSQNLEKSGMACNNWHNYKQDIKLMKELGVKSYRFSVEWSRIEPSQGVFDQDAIQHYHDLIDELVKNQIVPMITLHHFTHPIWFEEKGGFENKDLISFFVNFSEKVFTEYSSKVKLWCTINEPEIFTYFGYIDGTFPPGKKSFASAEKVLTNLLESHVQIYHKLKNMKNGRESQIGIVKDIFQGEPYTWWNPIHWIAAYIYNHIMNENIIRFFETGKFKYYPFITTHTNVKATRSLDFIGLNYYSHIHFKPKLSNFFNIEIRPEEQAMNTEMNYPVYAEGMYRALKRLGSLSKPIYVTETGAPDSNDKIRELWIKRYIFAVQKAIYEGVVVRGFYYWTLMDNFEWAHGWKQKFGLYEFDHKTEKTKLRNGSKFYQNLLKKFK